MSTEKTFKIYEDSTEEFNVVKATQKNIEGVCGVMVRCNYLSAQETIHYAQIAGFKPEKNDKGEDTFTFNKDVDKVSFVKSVLPVLFKEKPDYKDTVDREQVQKAVDFFFTRFGEYTHGQMRCLNLYQAIQNLPSLMSSMKALTDTKTES